MRHGVGVEMRRGTKKELGMRMGSARGNGVEDGGRAGGRGGDEDG